MSYQYMSTGESKHLAVKYALVPLDLVLVHAEDIIQRVRARGEIEKRVTELKDAIRKLRAHREAASQEPVADDPLALWMEEDRS